MTTRRNDPCPCGSGEKFKRCCEGKNSIRKATLSRSATIAGAIALVAVAGVLAITLNRSETTSAQPPAPGAASVSLPAPASAPQTNQPAAPGGQPPLPAPPADIAVPGRVWSPEHKHWHNVSQAENPIVVESVNSSAPNVVSVPRPENSQVIRHPQPPGPAPAGKVWSPLHGHWHDAPAAGATTATQGSPTMDIPPPAGPAPEGKVWSRQHGHWHDAPRPQ
jgi:hypothetical protein